MEKDYLHQNLLQKDIQIKSAMRFLMRFWMH